MKANRFCLVRGHENTVASRICTFDNCQNQSRWLCSECLLEKLHHHDQKNKDHIMRQQQFNNFILYSSKIHLNKLNFIKQSIKRLQYIVQCSTNLIYQLEEQFKKVSIQLIEYKHFNHQVNEDFLSIDVQQINQILELQQNPDFLKSQNLQELQSKIYQVWKVLMKMNSKCVLIGSPSSGKTTIFNKICELKYKKDLQSTLQITQSESKFGICFTLIDTPGVPTMHDTFNNCLRMIGALTEHPINRILLILNYSASLDNLLSEIRPFIQILSEYQHLIILIINLRRLIIDEENQKVIKRIISQNFKINTILFYDCQVSKESLCSSIDSQLNLYPQQLQFSNQKIYYLMKSIQLDFKLSQGRNDFYTQFGVQQQSFNHYLNFQLKKKTNKTVALNELQMSFLNQIQLLKSKFLNEYDSYLQEILNKNQKVEQAYYFYFTITYGIDDQVQLLLKDVKQQYGQDEKSYILVESDIEKDLDMNFKRYLMQFDIYKKQILMVLQQNKVVL